MLEGIAKAALGYLEKELISYEPELQAYVLGELTKLSSLLGEYLLSKVSGTTPAAPEAPAA